MAGCEGIDLRWHRAFAERTRAGPGRFSEIPIQICQNLPSEPNSRMAAFVPRRRGAAVLMRMTTSSARLHVMLRATVLGAAHS